MSDVVTVGNGSGHIHVAISYSDGGEGLVGELFEENHVEEGHL